MFGEGFIDLVKDYGGKPVSVEARDGCWRISADPLLSEMELEKQKYVEAITPVNCDTPSAILTAILNNLEEIRKTAKEHGSLLIVGAVSSIGSVPINLDETGIGIFIDGSQKALNTPPGSTIVAIGEQAWERMEKVNYRGLYLDLKIWRHVLEDKGMLPHSMSDVLVYALNKSLKMIIEEGLENVYKRHEASKKASWATPEVLNLEPHPLSNNYSSPTATALELPRGVSEGELRKIMWNRCGVMIAGSWGRLQGKVVRIGHMGFKPRELTLS